MTNFDKSKESLSGPVAIVAVGAEVARSDVANLYQFAAILNINLAVINILPLPVGKFSLCGKQAASRMLIQHNMQSPVLGDCPARQMTIIRGLVAVGGRK